MWPWILGFGESSWGYRPWTLKVIDLSEGQNLGRLKVRFWLEGLKNFGNGVLKFEKAVSCDPAFNHQDMARLRDTWVFWHPIHWDAIALCVSTNNERGSYPSRFARSCFSFLLTSLALAVESAQYFRVSSVELVVTGVWLCRDKNICIISLSSSRSRHKAAYL